MTKSKYQNEKVVWKGHKFDSKKEARFAMQLDQLKMATFAHERVVKYELQPVFVININNIFICKYIADFKVFYADGSVSIIDVKGFKTPVYKLKKKLAEAVHGIKIKEV